MPMTLTPIDQFCPGDVVGAQSGSKLFLFNSGASAAHPNHGSYAVYDNATNTAREFVMTLPTGGTFSNTGGATVEGSRVFAFYGDRTLCGIDADTYAALYWTTLAPIAAPGSQPQVCGDGSGNILIGRGGTINAGAVLWLTGFNTSTGWLGGVSTSGACGITGGPVNAGGAIYFMGSRTSDSGVWRVTFTPGVTITKVASAGVVNAECTQGVYDGTYIWWHSPAGAIYRFDPSTNAVDTSFAFGGTCGRPLVKKGSILYTVDTAYASIRWFDTATLTLGSVPAGRILSLNAFLRPDGKLIFPSSQRPA